MTCLYTLAHTHLDKDNSHLGTHTLTTTQLIWSVISSVKAWQRASSLYCCNERSVDRSSTQVWPRGTWPGFKWCSVIKNKTLVLVSGKGWVQVQSTWQGRLLHFTDRLYFLISSSTDTLVVPFSRFLACHWLDPGGRALACIVRSSCYPESLTVHPHRLCWQGGFTCLGLSAQSGFKPTSIIRTLASFPPSPDPVGRWLSAGVSVLSQDPAF